MKVILKKTLWVAYFTPVTIAAIFLLAFFSEECADDFMDKAGESKVGKFLDSKNYDNS